MFHWEISVAQMYVCYFINEMHPGQDSCFTIYNPDYGSSDPFGGDDPFGG